MLILGIPIKLVISYYQNIIINIIIFLISLDNNLILID